MTKEISPRERRFLEEVKNHNMKFKPCHVENLMLNLSMTKGIVVFYVYTLKKRGLIEVEEGAEGEEIYAMI